jgi:GntR family transcriptional regulator, arabinose operon transcriptional repressor
MEREFRLDTRSKRFGRLKHEQLKAHLVSELVAGRLKAGQLLPSESQFAEMLGITRKTVRRAMASLESDGLIRREQGKGNFVEDNARHKLKRGLDIFALLVPETRGGFYPALLHGFESAAGDVHHQTLICNTENDVSRQGDIVLQLLDKQIGGVAMVPTSQPLTPAHQVRQLQNHGVPVVFCHRRVEEIVAPLLAIPFHEVGCMAGRVLTARGHRRVAYFVAEWSPVDPVIQDGLNETLRDAGCDGPAKPMSVSETISFQEEDVLAALQKLFAKPDPPTAIFASFDTLAEMIYFLMPRLGLRVPEDVSLLGFGGVWRDGVLARRLTSVVVDEVATGQKAVSLLHEMRRGERPIDDNSEFAMELSLSEGKTLGTPRRNADASEN